MHLSPCPPLDLALWMVMGHVYFASGSSAPADVRGLARWLHPIGVSIPELSEPVLLELERNARLPIPVFVDTGAFSEVAIDDAGAIRVVRPIADARWAELVAVELRLAAALGPNAYCVAPDRVGDQTETLRRLALFAPAMRELRARGARVVVPLQRGARSTSAFHAAAAEVLGFDDFVAAVPGNKAALPDVELERFLRVTQPPALHLLGLGPRSHRFPAMCDLLHRFGRGVAVSYDSNLLTAHVGRSNGKGGSARILTALQEAMDADGSERAREDAVAMLVGPSMLMARLAKGGHPWVGVRTRHVPRQLFDGLEGSAP